MNHVEAARSSCGIFPNVRGMWGYRLGCSCQRYEQRIPNMFLCCPSSSISAKEFLPLHSRIVPDSLPGASQLLPGGIRSTPQVSWLVSGINTPEGSCDAEEFCCNEFAAALLEDVLSATCDLSWCVCCSSDSHLQVMFFFKCWKTV